MDDLGFGRLIRILRLHRGWRQADLAARAGVSRRMVQRVEAGGLDGMPLASIRAVCRALDVRVELLAKGRGAEIDRVRNDRHSALQESVARWIAEHLPAWHAEPEVSFNVRGERGVIDLLLWHPGHRALLIIEFKTELADLGDLLATADRRERLARDIVRARGWDPSTISTWVVVAASRTTERRISAHRVTLRTAFPQGDRDVRAWLRRPEGTIRALSTWAASASAPVQRVRRVRAA